MDKANPGAQRLARPRARRPAQRRSVQSAALGFLIFTLGGQAFGVTSAIVPAEQSIAGASQGEWAMRWWQWAFSFDQVRSPIADRTGERCASRQEGDVWFLAGTYGSRRVERTCTIPFGKTLFFPLINYVAFRGDGSQENCMSLASRAAALTNDLSALVLEIDGTRYDNLKVHRQASACFSVVPGQKPDSVSNGYYIAIRPLSRGRHTLNFGGVLPNLAQAVTYTIVVE
ncbi:hypothetical protein [Ideonella sp.]|uniref:hypothetical protein n=1 Tax=Ideonella sp. TaxID=1929293 RepID=UPI003BB7DDA0